VGTCKVPCKVLAKDFVFQNSQASAFAGLACLLRRQRQMLLMAEKAKRMLV
jgi:hypothetical protein